MERGSSRIFKYSNSDGAKQILGNLTLLFKTPDLFNDPNDCDFSFTEKAARKAFALVEEYEVLQEFRRILEEKGGNIKKFQRPIVTFGKWVFNTQQKLVAKNHQFDSNPAFRLLFRSKANKNRDYWDSRNAALERYSEEMKNKFGNLRKSVYVCCFSKRCDSILMWSHYADQFKGVCIEWPSSSLHLEEVHYSKKKPQFDIRRAVSILLGYSFAGEEPDAYNPVFKRMEMQLLLTKGNDWAYEEELRWIVEANSLIRETFDPLGDGKALFHLRSLLPIRVFLGERIAEEDEKEIRSLCRKIGCEVIKTATSKTEFAVVSEDGEPLN